MSGYSKMGCLLVSRNDLFGARMLPFINALRIGHDYDLPVKIFWPVNGGDTTNIGQHVEIFSPEFLKRHFIQADEFQDLTKRAIGLTQIRLTPVDEIVAMVRSGSILALNGGNTALTLGGEDESLVRESYRATMDRISFTPTIHDNIQRIQSATRGQKFTAYHVRHGDVTTSYRAKNKPWPNKFIPSELFVQHFEKHAVTVDQSALLFGDFKPSLDWLCTQCAGFRQIGDVIDFGSLGSLQRDFLELYAMSRASKIVGPQNSGFSQLAASFGGIELLDITKSLGPRDYKTAFGKLFKRIDEAPETLSSKGEIGQCIAHLAPYLMRNRQSAQLVNLLTKEIKRGNNISYLFPLLAQAQMAQKDFNGILKTRNRSLAEPMFDPTSVADLDAITAQAAFHLGDKTKATRLLAMAVFHTPYAPEVKRAYQLLDQSGTLNNQNFYPIDRELMALLHKGLPQFSPVHFAWEWRYSLISNFQRPLTFAGAADLFVKNMDKSTIGIKLSDFMQGRFDSFKSLVLMGLGHVDAALTLSINAVDLAPNDPFILKRHIQNLLLNRDYDLALRYAKMLIGIAPDIPMYQLLLAECYFGKKKRAKAIKVFDSVNSNDLRFPGGALRHGGALLALKQPKEVAALMDRVLPETRWPDQHLDILTSAKIALDQQSELLPFLEELSDESYKARKVSHMLARIKLANHDYEGAEKECKRAIAFAPNMPRFREQLARVYIAQGRQKDAADVIKQLPAPMQKRFL